MRPSRQWLVAALLIIVLIAVTILAFGRGGVAIGERIFQAETLDRVAEELRGFGPWTPIVSVALMVLQSVLAPLPGSLVAAANGAIYGVWTGTLLSWAGGMAGGLVTYALGRGARTALTSRWGDTPLWRRFHDISATHGFWVVLIARLTPIVSLDVVGYLAGMARMPLLSYALANAIGIVPGMLAYTMLGNDLVRARSLSWQLAAVLLGLAVLFVAGRWWLGRCRLI